MLFVISEDWFFASHFLGLAEAVRAAGFSVSVHCRIGDPALQARFEASGLRVLPSRYDRGAAGRRGDIAQIGRFYRLFRRERPDVVHVISLRVVLIAGVAARLARVPTRVHALTGLGVLGAGRSRKARAVLDTLGTVLRRGLGGAGAGFLFENRDDPRRLGFDLDADTLLVVGGAGIDPVAESALPLPPGPGLRLALVARMIRSKGIAVAVDAVTRARRAGADVTLTLVGDRDPGNPRSYSEAEMRAFAQAEGVRWIGKTDDVRAVWRQHHAACVPSLGGEGLPRSLLEAAAAARPIITTDTPGCAAFVRQGVEGFIVPPGDASALARSIAALAADPPSLDRMGAAARTRVLQGFTRDAVSDAVIGFYDHLSRLRRRGGRG